jgi:small subunit ribosomal protein S4
LARFRRRRQSDYARQLREKQKAKRIYGVLERQLRRFYREAERRSGMTGENLVILLERRLDNVIYRLGLADSRPQARQLVAHGHFLVNGKRTKIPSRIVRPEDVITVRDASLNNAFFKERVKKVDEGSAPSWLSLDADALTGRMMKVPTREEIDTALNEQMIVEYYSR